MSSKRRGLGRGLDALLEGEQKAAPTSAPIDRLRPNRYQPRTSFDASSLAELAASISSKGVVQPIIVTPRDGGYTIIAGERRWRAARQAGLKEVPVIVREAVDDREMFELALVENLQRSDLNPIEEAEAYQRLLEEFDLKQEEVAVRVGKGRTTITNALRLLGLPPEVQDLLRVGDLTAGQVRPLLALESAEEQIRWARRATREKLSARQMEQAVTKKGSQRKRRAIDPDTTAAADKLTKIFQTRVDIRRRGKGGTLTIAFHSEDELMRLYDLLVRAGGRR